jgi:hypothetical protein
MKRVEHLILVASSILLLASCSGHATVCKSSFHESANLTRVCAFPVESGADLATLYLEASLESGAITWTLRDPSGNARWEDHCESSNGSERVISKEFSIPPAGNWQLELFLQDAIGEYCCIWKTQ